MLKWCGLQMRYIILSLILIGCASPQAEIIKMDDGVFIKANTKSLIKYNDGKIDVEFDSRGNPLIALDIPDVKLN